MKKLNEINQSDSAKRKLKNISKNNNLPLDFVTTLYNFNWDLDPVRPTESIGWVHPEQYTQSQFEQGAEIVCNHLGIDKNKIEISKKQVIHNLINVLKTIDKNELLENFLIAGETGNKCYLSEFSTVHYLNNYSEEKLFKLGKTDKLLDTKNDVIDYDEKYTMEDFISFLFVKVFRAGSIERGSLFYCYTDLCFDLPYIKQLKSENNWINTLVTNIEKQDNSKLSDLIKNCKSIVKGNKYFKQSVLEALSYSGDLKVKGIDVSKIFIPFYKDELASHFYSNEWKYPLRMWNENKTATNNV